MSVLSELEAKQVELEAEKKAILEARDAEIAAARQKYAQGLKEITAKYAQGLKEITAKQGRVKRMVKTATEKL